jgi:LuxR family transcriptional regulator, maltose regulon positive regulatory protein
MPTRAARNRNTTAHATAGTAGLVATKLRAPGLPAGLVARARLLERLKGAAGRSVLISAPAGFGKTVLLTEWLRSDRPPHAWVSIDALDNDPKRLVNHLAAAVGALGTDAAERAAALLRGVGNGESVALDGELQQAFDDLDPRTVLVLDDLHELEAGPSLAVVQALMERRPAVPRLVMLTRVDPQLPLGRMRVGGELLELREQDLRFTGGEAAELFERLLPGGLDAELVERLGRRTEGWVAGLRMAAIALEHAEDRRVAVDAFTGSHRFVVDYLVEEAVGRQGAAVQQFLMETSVLGRFTEDTCVAVTGNAAARELLYEVEQANLFLVPLGPDRRWYRYHHLFAELLQFRLRRLHPELLDTLHERASAWFEADGDIAQALEHASRMSTPDRLSVLLDVHALGILSRSELASLKRWVGAVPDPLAAPYPTFLLAAGWLRLLTERVPDLDPLLAAAYAALDRGPAGYDEAAVRTSRFELDVLRAFHARFTGRYHDALAIGGWLLASLPADGTVLRGRVLYNQARTHMMLCEMAPAAELLQRGTEDNLRAGTYYLVLTGLGQMGAILLELDGVARARQALDAAVRMAEERQLARLPAFATVLYQLGYVHLVADDLDAAESCFQRAIALATRGGMPEGRANGLVGLCRIHVARGSFVEAESLLAEAELLDRTDNVVLVDGDMRLERARFEVNAGGHGRDARASLSAAGSRRGHPEAAAEWSVIEETRHLLCLLNALRSTAPDAPTVAARFAARIVHESASNGRHVAAAVARVAEALLMEGDERWAHLDDALREAAARGYVRPLLDIGEPLRLLLMAAQARPLSPAARAHARLLLSRLDGGSAGVVAAGPAPVAAAYGADLLTDREREVLVHICRGLSNKAIARAMFVSAETVKTHLKHIYDKLDVSDRRSAARRAAELGLAPAEELPRP